MHGRTWSLLLAFALGLALLAGCDATAPLPSPAFPPAVGGKRFDPDRAGDVRGKVVWRGPLPAASSFRSVPEPLNDPPAPSVREWANPNAPVIDAKTSGVAGAVVWLRNVDPDLGRPWDLPSVRVEMKGQQFHVLQGASDRRSGFVRPGESFDLVSRDRVFHSVQARGAGFFACPLPDTEKICSRRVDTAGVVELSSGCGYFWMRAYLLVTPHPYVVHTDEQGRFTLANAPAGEYEIVGWHPHGRVIGTERNPDNGRVQQARFAPPLQTSKRIRVEPRRTTSVVLELAEGN